MRAFVLTTGRSGSATFAAACAHTTNFTIGHETRTAARDRLQYADQHIEVDNRLVWFLGSLHAKYPNAYYVHLIRDRSAVVNSYIGRTTDDWGIREHIRGARLSYQGHRWPWLTDAFNYGILQQWSRVSAEGRRRGVELLVDTVCDNIAEFLRDKPHMVIDLDGAADHIGEFWSNIGAEGDLPAACAEFSVRRNASA